MDLTRAGGDWMDHAQAVAWFDNVKKSNVIFSWDSVTVKESTNMAVLRKKISLFIAFVCFWGDVLGKMLNFSRPFRW